MARNEVEPVSLMEPVLPAIGDRELEDLAIELTGKAGRLAGRLHPAVCEAVGDLVRSMNCYYSNLIEGHHTHPRDIDRALAEDYSTDPEQRNLQLEARAHIEVQRLVDQGSGPAPVVTVAYLQWLHREFCRRLPVELLHVDNPDTGERLAMIPGVLRERDVAVGRHVPPRASSLEQFLRRFAQAYDPGRLSRVQQLIGVAASHHRLLWIHPFLDGNGRVARLFAHAWLRELQVGSSLWSVSRGLARDESAYKRLLMDADSPRRGDLDGRGNLSAAALKAFCVFFLETCIDQVDFMASLLAPETLLDRIERWSREEIAARRLPKGSFALLREALLAGGFERGRVTALTAYKDRKARDVLYQLMARGLLIADSPRGKVQLAFPAEVAEAWFPSLYDGHREA